MTNDKYEPRPEHKFSFGLWTVGNRGRDPFGEAVRPTIPPNDIVALLAEVGAWGVNLHDNDLVPIDATPAERDRIVREFTGRMPAAWNLRPHGDGQLVLRSSFSRRSFHRQRSQVSAPTPCKKP